MKKSFFTFGLVFLASYSGFAAPELDCDDLDGFYQEETGFFSFEISDSIFQNTGKVSYDGQVFYYRYHRPLVWDPQLRACAARAHFRVGACSFPVTGYVRKKLNSDEYISGVNKPVVIEPNFGCRYSGTSQSQYTFIRSR